ncbi:MAG TPA: signal peptidase I [Gemmatimonadaceae bacterium]|jgi:signal peptidase I
MAESQGIRTPASTSPLSQFPDALRADALRAVNRPRARVWHALVEWAKSVSVAIVLFLFARTFFIEAFKIPSGSMEGTLLVGDFLLVNKMLYGAEVPLTGRRLPAVRAPKHGDVVVFEYPRDPSKHFVKRLVGLPGDTLAMLDGVLILNGSAQQERYAHHSEPGVDRAYEEFEWQRDYLVRSAAASGVSRVHPSRNNWGPIVVPPRHYFMLGDNRDNSLDSRYWGFVPDSLLKGAPLFIYYSYSPDTAARVPWLSHIRWRRLGTRIQ